jgi:uncharacterized protein YjbI with pentapeptide repeats
MMVQNHIEFLLECINKGKQGINEWNEWRKDSPEISPMLEKLNFKNLEWHPSKGPGINFSNSNLISSSFEGAKLNYANFNNANLTGSVFTRSLVQNSTFEGCEMIQSNFEWSVLNFSRFSNAKNARAFAHATMKGVNFDNCMLRSSSFVDANLESASFINADLSYSYLTDANLLNANLTNANLSNSTMLRIRFVNTIIEGAVIKEAKIYGMSAWNLKGTPKIMNKLKITFDEESEITVDDLDLAQFIHLLLRRENLRNVINTITSKAVLILGRFTTDRKEILDLLANELRNNNLLPIIFDFEKANSRDFTETIKVLAGLSFFIIADITDPSSIPLELDATVPDFQIPFITVIERGGKPFSMFKDLKKYSWIFDPVEYSSKDQLINEFKEIFLDRAFEKNKEIIMQKNNLFQTQPIEEFLMSRSH